MNPGAVGGHPQGSLSLKTPTVHIRVKAATPPGLEPWGGPTLCPFRVPDKHPAGKVCSSSNENVTTKPSTYSEQKGEGSPERRRDPAEVPTKSSIRQGGSQVPYLHISSHNLPATMCYLMKLFPLRPWTALGMHPQTKPSSGTRRKRSQC